MTLDITEKEGAVLRRLAHGYSREEIAVALGVSVATVNARIYAAQNRTGTRTSYHLLAAFVAERTRASEEGESTIL